MKKIIFWVLIVLILTIFAFAMNTKQFLKFTIKKETPGTSQNITVATTSPKAQTDQNIRGFETKTNPSQMTLYMHSWKWQDTTYSGNKITKPTKENVFLIAFDPKRNFSASTDCNGVGGEYSIAGKKITLNKMVSTMMFCENSQEGEFSKMLSDVQGYHFTTDGKLIFELKTNKGLMTFK